MATTEDTTPTTDRKPRHCWLRLRLHRYGLWQRPNGVIPRRHCAVCGKRQFGTDYPFGVPPEKPASRTELDQLARRVAALEARQ